ncbi:MAG TPA: DNA methyltransferase [Xanthobacteraceae bacterium]|jgi:site-specific DNA-methyltransferase (adenine-specific)|nr:DNA methyltransferase [Xanthobacteraceae bacterium]
MSFNLIHGNSLEKLRDLPDDSVESCVTDPPYELGFMGRKWDASGIAYNVELWRQVHRVLKPGGHLAAFGGTRTYHRMAVAIEDAGFEIRVSFIGIDMTAEYIPIARARIDEARGDLFVFSEKNT